MFDTQPACFRPEARFSSTLSSAAAWTMQVALLSCLVTFQSGAQDLPGAAAPIPLDVIASLQGHNGRSPINLSPDGSWIAHTIQTVDRVPRDSGSRRYSATGVPFAEGDARMEATLSNARTGEIVRLGGAASSSWGGVWSPTGHRVAFYSDEGGIAGLWIWELATRRATRVPDLIVRPFFGFETARWTADGKRVVVKTLPRGMTIDEANAQEPGAAGVPSRFPSVPPGESSVLVRRFDPRRTATDTSRTPRVSDSTRRVVGDTEWAEVDLVMVDVENGDARILVERAPVRAYALSPDEQHIAYTVLKGAEENSQQPNYDLIVRQLDSDVRRTLGTNLRMAYGIEWNWAPDSRRIAMIESGQLASGDMIVYTVADGSARSLASDVLPSFDPGDGEYPPLWNHRGDHLYAVGAGTLWRLNVTSGRAERVAQMPGWRIRSLVWQHGQPTFWSADGGRTAWLIAREDSGSQAGIFAVDLTTGQSRAVLQEEKIYLSIFNLGASDSTGEIAFVSSGQRQLPEVWLLDTERGGTRRASRINADLDRYELGTARLIEWRTADGQLLRGTLLLPPGFQMGTRIPLVVWVYGGSMGSGAVNRFGLTGIGGSSFNMQVLATRGYAVLFPDAPIREGMAMADLLRTVLPGVDAAIAQGYADPDRLAVMGQSYGSYSTLALITQTTRFKAAVITAAVLHPDLFADYLRSIGYYERGQGNMGGSIWEFPDRYRDNSPLFHFDKIETPLLIGQGERDGNLVPVEAIFAALQRLERQVEYRLYQGEGHVITQKPNVLDFWRRRLAFLAEHLDLMVDADGAVVFEAGRARTASPR